MQAHRTAAGLRLRPDRDGVAEPSRQDRGPRANIGHQRLCGLHESALDDLVRQRLGQHPQPFVDLRQALDPQDQPHQRSSTQTMKSCETRKISLSAW